MDSEAPELFLEQAVVQIARKLGGVSHKRRAVLSSVWPLKSDPKLGVVSLGPSTCNASAAAAVAASLARLYALLLTSVAAAIMLQAF